MKTLTAAALIGLTIAATGCSTFLPEDVAAIREAIIIAAERIGDPAEPPAAPPVVAHEPAPDEPQAAPPRTDEPQAPGWRSDHLKVAPVDGVVAFETLDIPIPTKRNKNARRNKKTGKLENGHEYIIAWINTSGGRVLHMAMYDRSGSRIYAATGEKLRDKPFPMPLMGVHRWRICQEGADVVSYLDGKEYDRRRGVQLLNVIINGAKDRESGGEWRRI